MTAAARLDIVAASPAVRDRRALSEAWFSALHLASGPLDRSARRLPAGASPAFGAPLRRHAGAAIALGPARFAGSAALRRPQARPAGAQARSPLAERRRAPSVLARRIMAAIRTSPARISFTVTTPQGRVHLTVRREGGAVRLIAVCTANARASVERALAETRFALAGGGLAIAW